MNPTISFDNKAGKLRLLLFLMAPLLGASFAFTGSYMSNTNVWLGTCLFFYALHVEGKSRFNVWYFAMVLILGGIAYVYQVRMFYFLALGIYILFILEWTNGKLNVLILFLLLFMSPVFHQVAVIFGFPIRLQLSQWAGAVLGMAGWDIHVVGNVMVLNGNSFSVDGACMGLNMLAMSMLMGVFVLAHRYKTEGKTLGFLSLSVFFLLVFGLNIGANLARILLLVIFKILPENALHEGFGILCLLGYVMLPTWLLSRWWIRRFGQENGLMQATPLPSITEQWVLIPVGLLLMGIGIGIGQTRSQETITHAPVHVPGLQETQMKDGITKFQNDSILLYVKPIPEFFTGEHSPLLCWTGSGYEFKSVKKTTFKGVEIYMGLLEKSGAKLYTAWWYDNGSIKTIDQWEWRMRMLKGEAKFCLFNLSADGEAELYDKLATLFDQQLLAKK